MSSKVENGIVRVSMEMRECLTQKSNLVLMNCD